MATRRVLRAFTLACETSDAVDALLKSPTARAALFPKSEAIDERGLLPEDYERLYALIPGKHNPYVPRDPDHTTFMLHLNYALSNGAGERSAALTKTLNTHMAVFRKKNAAYGSKLNASRIVDALIARGLDTLEPQPSVATVLERRKTRSSAREDQPKTLPLPRRTELNEAAASSRSNALQGRDKLSLTKGRKGASI